MLSLVSSGDSGRLWRGAASICEFHILKDLNQAILRARLRCASNSPPNNPNSDEVADRAKRKLAQKRQRLQQKIADLLSTAICLSSITSPD